MPPIFSMLVFTTSMPTPRPEMFVTFCAVENPAMKDQVSDLAVRHCGGVLRSHNSALDGLGLDRIQIESAPHHRRSRC